METLRKAGVRDRTSITHILSVLGLPLEGADEHTETTWVVDDFGVRACVMFENYGDDVLLRSLAVLPSEQGKGLGVALTQYAIGEARRLGAQRVWLLTETADKFFPRFGFESVARSEAPAALEASKEFQGACPQSARLYKLDLDQGVSS